MRIKIARLLMIIVVLVNLAVLHHIWKLLSYHESKTLNSSVKLNLVKNNSRKHFLNNRNVTIVLRDIEFFENNVAETIESLQNIFPRLKILIVVDSLPYPPLNLKRNDSQDVKMINLQVQLHTSAEKRNPLFHIRTKYVLFLPDSVHISTTELLLTMLSEVDKHPHNIISVPSSNSMSAACLQIFLSVKEWTLQYNHVDEDVCDSVTGRQALLLEADILRMLPEPFMIPFPEAIYIQSSAKKLKQDRCK
ncbi:ribitol 5-phosphate transferase FKRP isoform X6 [Bacillus rossius redtenbacheri]|uniref:ribitol 5-phosphate transferase FKRP isoform X6 n=1 Tax=Bacillus rossius redtenbacheri TaxID=93214 RepID=UPI002FDEDC5B